MNHLSQMGIQLNGGDSVRAEESLLQAWEALPPPRDEWDFGQLVIQQAIGFYLKTNRPAEAQQWLDPLASSFGSKDDGTVAMISGTVYYEVGDFHAAFERFDFLHEQFGKRPFQGRDKKYLNFYLDESKKRGSSKK